MPVGSGHAGPGVGVQPWLSLARVMGPPRCHEHGTTRRCHRASTSPSELSTAPCPGRVRCR
ncbi:MAG: hypothetical protein EOP24_38520 [Hyphomicrobiales bacterium]|nr:MAG: hypothetical protein EOP24_38520 [Hyphomicrobiales bacterium]